MSLPGIEKGAMATPTTGTSPAAASARPRTIARPSWSMGVSSILGTDREKMSSRVRMTGAPAFGGPSSLKIARPPKASYSIAP